MTCTHCNREAIENGYCDRCEDLGRMNLIGLLVFGIEVVLIIGILIFKKDL